MVNNNTSLYGAKITLDRNEHGVKEQKEHIIRRTYIRRTFDSKEQDERLLAKSNKNT